MFYYLKHFYLSIILLLDGTYSGAQISFDFKPEDLDIQLVNEHTIDLHAQDQKHPKTLFQPTSILRPGYGTLFEHVGQVYHTVQTHFLTLGIHLPSVEDIPSIPDRKQFNYRCLEDVDASTAAKAFVILDMDDSLWVVRETPGGSRWRTLGALDVYRQICSLAADHGHILHQKFKHLHKDIYQKFFTEIPALLPNPAVPFVDILPSGTDGFDLHAGTSHSQTSSSKDSSYNKSHKKYKRSIPSPPLTFLEKIRQDTFLHHYNFTLPSDFDTLFAPSIPLDSLLHLNHSSRSKRQAAAFLRGANIFGSLIPKVIPTIKKIGGFIFKGIKSLFHRHKHHAMVRAVNIFRRLPKLLPQIGKNFFNKGLRQLNSLFKTPLFKRLHLSKVSLFNQLNLPSIKTVPLLNLPSLVQKAANSSFLYESEFMSPMQAIQNVTTAYLSKMAFLQTKYQDLMVFHTQATRLINGLATLATGKLSPVLIPPHVLLKLLKHLVKDVMHSQPGFLPIDTDLYHYYDTPFVSFTNTHDMLVIQVPVLFAHTKQIPLDIFRVQTTPVPLDADTYAGIEHKYTSLDLKMDYLAISEQEYAPISSDQLAACLQVHESYYCDGLRLTASTHSKSCAVSIFRDDSLDIIKDVCTFTYHNHLLPSPTILQSQDEILLAHLPGGWMLLCNDQIDRPIPFQDAIYAVVQKYDLCSCGILAQDFYLYEGMRTCDHPDTVVTLYYVHNLALLTHDPSIPHVDQKLLKHPPKYRAPDLKVSTPQTRTKRDADSSEDDQDSFYDTEEPVPLTMPLSKAIAHMESGDPIQLSPHAQCPVPSATSSSHPGYTFFSSGSSHGSSPGSSVNDFWVHNDMYFNIVTVLNALVHLVQPMIYYLCYRHRNVPLGKAASVASLAQPASTLQLFPVTTISYSLNTTSPPSKHSHCYSFLYLLLIIPFFFIAYAIVCILHRSFCMLSPLFQFFCKSSTSSDPINPSTAIFLDIVHILSGDSLRCYITTVAAPPAALAFSGNLLLEGFTILRKPPFLKLNIDWHSFKLHYTEHELSLPPLGTALVFQPNILTDFSRPGPYHILLLAKYMDAFLPIPHITNSDFITAIDIAQFPVHLPPPSDHRPYKAVQEALQLIPPSAPIAPV